MKAVAVISVLTAVVAAADSVIPGGISSTCASTLNSLDTNTQLQSCLNSIGSATSGLTATSSAAALNTALTSLCSTTTANACPDSLMHDLLTKFYTDCKNDFDESSGTLKAVYDSLYNVAPMRKSLCTQDTASGKFCVQTLAAAAKPPSSLVSLAQSFLGSTVASTFTKRDAATTFPNATTFGATNIVFQFLTPDSPQSVLCSACATEIMQAYVSYETVQPFAQGISASDILNGQTALWGAISKTCPSSSQIVANAGAAPSSSGAPIAAGALNAATNTKVSAGVLVSVAIFTVVLSAL